MHGETEDQEASHKYGSRGRTRCRLDVTMGQFLEDTQEGTHKEKEYGSDVGEILFSE